MVPILTSKSPHEMLTVHYATFLGDLEDSGKGIIDWPEEGYFEFYVAGYTQSLSGQPLQDEHKKIWEKACRLGKENRDWPFNKGLEAETNAWIKPDLYNKYDQHAMLVGWAYNQIDLPGTGYTGILGYVPKRISRFVKQNYDKIHDLQIKKVRPAFKEGYYNTKIACFYKQEAPPDFGDVLINRLADLEF